MDIKPETNFSCDYSKELKDSILYNPRVSCYCSDCLPSQTSNCFTHATCYNITPINEYESGSAFFVCVDSALMKMACGQIAYLDLNEHIGNYRVSCCQNVDGNIGDDHASWLEEIGFKTIVDNYKAGKLVNEALLCKETLEHSLTKQQVRVIRKRVAALNWDTVRRNKEKYHPKLLPLWTNLPTTDQPNKVPGGVAPSGVRIDRRAAHRHRLAREVAEDIFCNPTPSAYNDTLASSTNKGVVPLSFSPKLDLVLDVETPYPPAFGPISPASADHSFVFRSADPPTRYEDLSPRDLEGVRRLALIELTAILDGAGLRMARSAVPPSTDVECHVSPDLEACVERDRKFDPTRNTPLIFESMIRYLEKYGLKEEGILRVPGSLYRIKALASGMNESGGREDLLTKLEKMDCNPNDVGAMLKMFLRQLPNPLLTRKHILNFANVSKISDPKAQFQALNYLVTLLPIVYNQTLKILIRFLCHVVSYRDINKMSAENVATILAPNLFPRQFMVTNQTGARCSHVDQARECAVVIKLLLEHNERLWNLPAQLISQLRVINDTKAAKRKSKVVNEIQPHTNGKNSFSLPNQSLIDLEIITYLVGQNPKIITASLNHTTTTADIIERCKKFFQMDPSRHLQLYEEGGNICERSLGTGNNLRQVFNENPNCHLILKEKPVS